MVFNVPYLVVSSDCRFKHDSPISYRVYRVFYWLVLQQKLIVKTYTDWLLKNMEIHTLQGAVVWEELSGLWLLVIKMFTGIVRINL